VADAPLPDALTTLRRPAAVAQVGGFRPPPEEPPASWMGTVTHAAPGEGWPHEAGEPMHGLWDEHVDEDDERFGTLPGLKFGGWPLCVQSEVGWREAGEWVPGVEFVFQVDSDPKVGFNVGYGGVVYVGHRPDHGTWHLTTQAM
jgi:hypothetical protein